MTDPNYIDEPASTDDAPEAENLGDESPRLDEPPADKSAPWFGYIGAGIVIFSMLVGLGGVVAAVLLFIRWTQ